MNYFQTKLYFSFLLLCVLCLFSCQEDKTEGQSGQVENKKAANNAPINFSLLPSEKTGINFENTIKPNLLTNANLFKYVYFYNGGGVAIGDLNNDGLSEIMMTGNQVPNKLYLNEGNFKFKDISKSSNIPNLNRWSTGVTMADVNQDGFLDIYVCNSGPGETKETRQNELYINNGDLTFTESAEQYGVADDRRSTHASFFDYDKDGDLDLIVMNHAYWTFSTTGEALYEISKNPALAESRSAQLYQNNGNNTFSNVSKKAGIDHYSFGLGLATSDINQDGNVDAYISNDFIVPDYFYANKGDGTFSEILKNFTRQISWFGMGCDVADINNDALPDIAVVDMTSSDHIRSKTLMPAMSTDDFWTSIESFGYQYQYMFNSLQINNGNYTFSNVANLTGIHQTDWSWATLFVDFDNDGDKDNFISNGYRKYNSDNDFNNHYKAISKKYNNNIPLKEWEDLYNQMPEQKLSNLLYRNDGGLYFEETAEAWGLAAPSYSNGAAYGDLDNDGDLDLIVNNIDDQAFVYRNELGGQNNYLQIVLKGSKKGENTFNTKVTLEYNGQKQFQEFSPVRGYQSSMEPILHFGLGQQKSIDKIEIVWPDGKVQFLQNVKSNQRLEVVKNPTSTKNYAQKRNQTFLTQQNQNIFQHKENKYNDFETEVLLPHKQSTLGPFISTGDVNGDGIEDFFVGGAKGQAGQLSLVQGNGAVQKASSQPWKTDSQCEDMGSCFFDVDQDGDLDLYVVSGGNEAPKGSPLLQDRLYINDGKGNFKKGKLPNLRASGQRVKAMDYDQDGDLDLLVAGRAIPKQYPYADRTFLLENNKGSLRDVTQEIAPDLTNPGIVTDFVWTDFNGDKKPDLIVVGEWMSVQFYENNGNGFSKTKELKDQKGWWYSIAQSDLDNDGDMDFVLGNIGKNNKFQAKAKKPLYVYCNDFDESGSFDIVLSKTYKGELVPTRGRQCSSEQMPFITEKFPNYNAFAQANIEELYGKSKLSEGLQLEANQMESIVLWNEGGNYTAKSLPIMGQIAPINGIILEDVNKDGLTDIITAGNMFHTEVETQRYDAGQGAVFINKGEQNFEFQPASKSGFLAPLDVKDIQLLQGANSKNILVANNNGPVVSFRLK